MASTISQPSNSYINIGLVNPSYGLENDNSFAWNSTHSPELIERWAQERGKFTYYVYSTINLELISTFFGANQISKFLDIGLYSAYYITITLGTSWISLLVFITYQNSLENKNKICLEYKNQKGCYILTHIKSGKQYVGSSRNLGVRLNVYFINSYLKN